MKTALKLLVFIIAVLSMSCTGKISYTQEGENKIKYKVIKTDSEWKSLLTKEQYRVLREKGTETAFTGKYWNNHDKGMYYCAACKNPLFILIACKAENKQMKQEQEFKSAEKMETAVFGAGCFWCVEAVFQQLKGVYKVEPGYTGGSVKNPTYKQVCTVTTGHAEVARIIYNPDEISFETLLPVFFKTHDPTTLNYQGADHGTQYRSAIFYTSEDQKTKAENIITRLNHEQAYPNPIVTEITKLTEFYVAEDYHHNYYLNNPNQGYCRLVIQPKVEKFRKVFGEYLK